MAFRTPICKLQLVIKDPHKSKKKKSPLPFSNDQSPSRWNIPTPSKSSVISQALQAETPSGLIFPYDEPTSMMKMMSRMVSQFRNEQNKKKSFRRSQSATKVKQRYYQPSEESSNTNQKVNQMKINIVKEIQSQQQFINIMTKKVEEENLVKQVQENLNRPLTAHDLQVRTHKRSQTYRRSQTARTTAKTIKSRTSKQSPSPTKSVVLSARKHGRVMSFNPAQEYEQEYRKKLKNYLDYIFKVNFSNGIYRQLALLPVDIEADISRYKVYVAKGNNSNLIRQLLKRRFWYQVVSNFEADCDFFWGHHQLKTILNKQKAMRNIGKKEVGEKQIEELMSIFEFRKEMSESKVKLNCKIMSNSQADKVEELILNNGHTVFQQPFTFSALTNRIPGTSSLTTKKNLFRNIKTYFEDVIDEDPYSIIPRTIYLQEFKGYEIDFFKHLATTEPKKLWIVKPGQNSSKTNGIQILPASKVLPRIKQRWYQDDQKWTFLVQAYIQEPLLYYNRKFDLRHFVLLTCINGKLKAFWYREGYIRTSSKDFPLVTKINCRNPQAKKFKNQFNEQQGQWLKKADVHFTNDSVQSQSDQYGKYQPGNKLSYADFQKFLDYQHAQYPFYAKTVTRMKQIALSVLKSVKGKIDPERRACNFQLIAFDYLIDEHYKVWLMKVKSNPSLQTTSPVLHRVIPGLIEQVIRFTVDPLFPPRNHFPAREKHTIPTDNLAALKFQLFYQE